MSYSLAQYETDTLDRNLSLWDDAEEPRKTFQHKGREVYRDSMNALRDAKTNRFVKGV